MVILTDTSRIVIFPDPTEAHIWATPGLSEAIRELLIWRLRNLRRGL